MKLFFASDLHGSLPATELVLEKYKASGADYLVILGDLLNHGPRNPIPQGYQPAAAAELLNNYSEQILAVRGNCDSEVDQMLLNFPMLETYSWILLESGTRIFLTHGHIYNSEHRPPLKAGDVIAHGHTHIPVAEHNGDQFIFNPGSITFPKQGYAASYGLYEEGTFTVLSFSDEVLKQVSI
ncbi:phosphodiesterase [Psychromonas ossibalaenae]|uniref:phosphodiesterase n=1 Tax=Psychromonas ossibalaenae TaxID=444922 RepID=UPI000369F114|nr:phosphodiesterase [Psychromonas ossibalaenae]